MVFGHGQNTSGELVQAVGTLQLIELVRQACGARVASLVQAIAKPVEMVYSCCTPGVPMVYVSCMDGMRMVIGYCTDGIRMVYVAIC